MAAPQHFLPDPHRGDYALGLLVSCAAHLLLVYVFLFLVAPRAVEFKEEVYSITIEGGKTLGGISQIPKDDKKTQLAVPRNVSAPEQKFPDPVAEKAEEKTQAAPHDAEVSLATPKPTSVATAKATPHATAKPAAKPTLKPTPKERVPTKAELDKEYQQTMQKYLGESTRAGGKCFGAAKATGGLGMGGGVLRPPEFFRYRDLLESYVKRGWHWFNAQDKLQAAVAFDIAPDGAVSNVRIDRSSGSREFDESVLRAVYKANPVPRPPESVYEAYFKSVRMIFEPQDQAG